MKNIAVLIDDLFEDIEYIEPVEAFKKAGHTVELVGKHASAIIHGKKENTELTIERGVKGAEVDDYDALFIPGGYSPDKLRTNEAAVQFAGNFVKSGKPVFTICHGPQVMITADVLQNRRMTGYQSIIKDIQNAGAEYIDEEVVIDDNLISSRNPHDLPAFIKVCLDKLANQ